MVLPSIPKGDIVGNMFSLMAKVNVKERENIGKGNKW